MTNRFVGVAREVSRQSRVDQGLPELISDPAVMMRLAALIGLSEIRPSKTEREVKSGAAG